MSEPVPLFGSVKLTCLTLCLKYSRKEEICGEWEKEEERKHYFCLLPIQDELESIVIVLESIVIVLVLCGATKMGGGKF